jgi:adenylosuccinate synthase
LSLNKINDERTKKFFAIDEAFHGIQLWEQYLYAAAALQSMIKDTGAFLRDKVNKNANILFESANGIHLDIDFSPCFLSIS